MTNINIYYKNNLIYINMATTTGNNYFTKSMNSIIEIDDGAGTTISDGVINCNSFSTADFNSDTINCNILNSDAVNTYNIVSDAVSGNTGTFTNFNAYTINNLANIISISSQYWKTGGIVMRPFNKMPNTGSWFSMNYDDNDEIEKNGLQFDVSGSAVNLIVDDGVPFKISTNGIDQITMTNVDGWNFGNKINASYVHANNVVSNFATLNKLTCPTGNITTVNASDLNSTYSTILESTTQNLTLRKDFNNPSNTVSLFFNTDASQTYYELNGTSQLNFSINSVDAVVMKHNQTTFNNIIISPTAKFNSIQPITTSSNFDLLTTSTGDINIGGSGKIYLNKSGYNGIETSIDNSVSPTPYIDFHSSGFNNNYDATIYCDGGTATSGEGNLRLTSKEIYLNGNLHFSNFLKTQVSSVKVLNQTYQNTNTTPKFISVCATNGSSSVLTAKTDSASPPTTQVVYTTLFNNVGQSIFFIVLPNNYYRVETSAGGTLQLWTEWG